jgi:hypothetical protein
MGEPRLGDRAEELSELVDDMAVLMAPRLDGFTV